MTRAGSKGSTKRHAAAVTVCVAAALALPAAAQANHPVLVEGNCGNPPGVEPFSTAPHPGTCGDFDGDARIGPAEDTDGDRVFGTINAANGPAGAANNGTITIVTSGLFPETVRLTGNVTLEGAPGVEAKIDAVRQGDPGSTPRQGQPGIVIDAPANRYVVVRNVQSRNWTTGVLVVGRSRATLKNVRVEHNVNYGIRIADQARVAITRGEVLATGFRLNPATGDFPTPAQPQPGEGIDFQNGSSGTVVGTTVAGSFSAGIEASRGTKVCVAKVNLFDNSPDLDGIDEISTSCPKGRTRR